jgi:hypothetical protein
MLASLQDPTDPALLREAVRPFDPEIAVAAYLDVLLTPTPQ